MMTPDEIIDVVKAFKNGKKIQSRSAFIPSNEWIDATNPTWDFAYYKYRIKPEPEVIYVNYFNLGQGTIQKVFYTNLNLALKYKSTAGYMKTVKFIECGNCI